MRRPFLAADKGTATAMTKSFLQGEHNRTWAKTMVVTINIKLDRILLHSAATSTVNPGIEISIPVWSTGTPAAQSSKWADAAEPCCSSPTIGFSMNSGRGTIQNKKHRGKSARLKARVQKQTIKAPIHHTT